MSGGLLISAELKQSHNIQGLNVIGHQPGQPHRFARHPRGGPGNPKLQRRMVFAGATRAFPKRSRKGYP
jgi:hypothetical protein